MHVQPAASLISIADQPLWAPGAAEMVAAFIRSMPGRARVLEFGSGGSTKFLLDIGAEVVAVEHHEGWAAALSDMAREKGLTARLTLLLRERPYSGVAAEFGGDTAFDLLLVDGRERMDCLRNALPLVRPGGLVLLDDSQRPRYWPAFETLAGKECTTFVSKARNTTIWTLDAEAGAEGFVRKSYVLSGRRQAPTPFVQLLAPAERGERLQPDYLVQRPLQVIGPVEQSLQKLGLIGRRATFIAPKGYRLQGASVRLEKGRKLLSQKDQLFSVGSSGLEPVDGRPSFSGSMKLRGHTLDLTASGAGRYAFFLLDSLPKLKLAAAAGFVMSDFDTVLVNTNAPWVRQLLRAVVGADCPQIMAFGPSAPSFQMLRSVHFDPVRAGRFTPGWIHRFLDQAFAPKEAVRDAAAGEVASFGSRVYISRERATGRRIINHDAFLELLKGFGFREVYAEDHSPADLVKAMAETRLLLSPHGAGLTNALFCPSNATVIELFASHFTPQYLYLARDRGQTYMPVACRDDEGLNVFDRYTAETPDKAMFNRKDIFVDLDQMEALLRRLV